MKKGEEKKVQLDQILKTNVFKIPEGYFTSLSVKVEARLITANAVTKANVFKVPEGYFELLPQKITSRLFYAKGLMLSELKKLPFITPPEYFNTLSEAIQKEGSYKKELEMEKSSETIHAVPNGYFDKLPNIIQERISRKMQTADTPVFLRPVVQYSIAASLLAAVFLSLVVLYNSTRIAKETGIAKLKQSEESFMATKLIANLSKEEIKKYLEHQENIDVQQLMEYSSKEKKQKIQKEFAKAHLHHIKLDDKEKKVLETELENMDLTEFNPEI
ncbi:MAG TPA: hypothetical protein VNW06_05940 [Cytophagaceae bacterium]|jgi:hypothetical protein|nr:hypothetical protein [Cytophagaceae bacterium]